MLVLHCGSPVLCFVVISLYRGFGGVFISFQSCRTWYDNLRYQNDFYKLHTRNGVDSVILLVHKPAQTRYTWLEIWLVFAAYRFCRCAQQPSGISTHRPGIVTQRNPHACMRVSQETLQNCFSVSPLRRFRAYLFAYGGCLCLTFQFG
jgi:hypothetical protein